MCACVCVCVWMCVCVTFVCVCRFCGILTSLCLANFLNIQISKKYCHNNSGCVCVVCVLLFHSLILQQRAFAFCLCLLLLNDVHQLKGTIHNAHYELLQLFAYGTYAQYKGVCVSVSLNVNILYFCVLVYGTCDLQGRFCMYVCNMFQLPISNGILPSILNNYANLNNYLLCHLPLNQK